MFQPKQVYNNRLQICTSFLDPFGHLIGMDGVILMAFLLGFPANEIVIPPFSGTRLPPA